MEDNNTFKVMEIEELIKTFPENYTLSSNNTSLDYSIKANFKLLEKSSEIVSKFSELNALNHWDLFGYNKINKNNSSNVKIGISFTNLNDKLALFIRSENAIVDEDYVFVIRTGNEVLYRGGVIPGKGYQVEKKFTVIPGENFKFPDLSNSQKNYPNHKPDILEIVVGKNSNYN